MTEVTAKKVNKIDRVNVRACIDGTFDYYLPEGMRGERFTAWKVRNRTALEAFGVPVPEILEEDVEETK